MSTHGSGEKKHSGFGERIKGAAHVVHGIGEDIRGSVLGALESGQGSEEAKAKDEGIATKGRSEIERGVAQMKGVAVPASTTAGPESHVEGKTGGQQQQPAKEEASTQTPAAPPAGPTQGAASAGAESHVEGKTGDQPQQQPAKQGTSGPPPPTTVSPQAAACTDEPQSRQDETESSRQEPTGQAGTENLQKSSQGTQAASEAKPPQLGDKGLVGEGGATQGPGSSV